MTLVGDLPVVEQRAAIGQVARLAGWVGHLPSVDNVSLHIDQVDRLVVARQWAEQGEAGKGAVRIVATQAHAAPLYRDGFNARREWRCRRLSGRAAGSSYRRSAGGDEEEIAAGKSSVRCRVKSIHGIAPSQEVISLGWLTTI